MKNIEKLNISKSISRSRMIRKIGSFIIIFLTISSLILPQENPRKLKFTELKFNPPRYNIANIKQGIDIYYMEDHETPTINVDIVFKCGSINDLKEKEGLSALTFRLLKRGGTTNISPDKIEKKLDFLGSSIDVYSDLEHSIISLWSLRKNFKVTWEILTEMLYFPAFDVKRLDSEKKKELEIIRRRWDNPTMIGMLLFNDLLYGKDFPEARRSTEKSIDSISKEDIISFYNEYIKNSEMIIALSGDFNPTEIYSFIKESFEKWQVERSAKLNLPKAKLATAPGIYVINKEDLTQSVVCMGHLGINRLDPDKAEINLLNFIYGTGSFNSRLMKEVRTNRGLAYIVYGNVGKGRDLGIFFNFCMTKNESVGEAIRVMKDIMIDITQKPISNEELTTALKYEQNSFVHLYESPQQILLWKIIYKIFNYPGDYLETYLNRIKKINREKVLDMAKRTIHPDKLVILVVGKKNEIYTQLKNLGLGEIKELPLPVE